MSVASQVSQEVFEARYEEGRDPWSFATSPYELARYQTTLESLSRKSYATVFEPGCSVGVLTQQLAALASRVIATDFAPSAVEQARQRCANLSNVEVRCADLSSEIPDSSLDLIVLSEIGYYFRAGELARIAEGLEQRLLRGGEFVAVHWLGNSADHILHADQVHEILHDCLPLRPLRSDWHQGYRLDSWVKP